MKIDLHVHCQERSACGRAAEEDQVRAAIRAGLDAIVFTDHHRLVPQARLLELNERYAPFRIFGGVEITTEGEDVLVYGLQDPALESDKWTYPGLHAFVHQRGGFLAVAHPFRYHPNQVTLDLEHYVPDALEVRSTNTPTVAEARIRAMAARWNIPLLCNSDAHRTESLGAYYNVLPVSPANDAELAEALRTGCLECGVGTAQVHMPPASITFKQADKVKPDAPKQHELL